MQTSSQRQAPEERPESMCGCCPGGIVILGERPAEKPVVAFFTTVWPHENHGQNHLFNDSPSL
jgi:hypothetical protein